MRHETTTKIPLTVLALLVLALPAPLTVLAQDGGAAVLSGAALTRVVPSTFYFQGQSAPTQMRNSAAVRFEANRFVIVGMVDTAGYSAEIRARYEGLFITDSSITIGGETLPTGAYGFGFSNDGKLNILDLGASRSSRLQLQTTSRYAGRGR